MRDLAEYPRLSLEALQERIETARDPIDRYCALMEAAQRFAFEDPSRIDEAARALEEAMSLEAAGLVPPHTVANHAILQLLQKTGRVDLAADWLVRYARRKEYPDMRRQRLLAAARYCEKFLHDPVRAAALREEAASELT